MPSKSKSQQRFMGMVHAIKKGELDPKTVDDPSRDDDPADVAKSIKPSSAKKFAKTKHKGLPNKVKKEQVMSETGSFLTGNNPFYYAKLSEAEKNELKIKLEKEEDEDGKGKSESQKDKKAESYGKTTSTSGDGYLQGEGEDEKQSPDGPGKMGGDKNGDGKVDAKDLKIQELEKDLRIAGLKKELEELDDPLPEVKKSPMKSRPRIKDRGDRYEAVDEDGSCIKEFPYDNKKKTSREARYEAQRYAEKYVKDNSDIKEEYIPEGLPTEKFQSAENKLVAYAKKNGGIDKKDFLDIAKMCGQIGRVNILQAGQVLARLNRKIDGLDTDVRDKVFEILKSVQLMENNRAPRTAAHRRAQMGSRYSDLKPSDKEIKMAIGIASDKRYAGGNMTGAVKAIEKIKKGLSQHPQVAAVLKRQNEDLEERADLRKKETYTVIYRDKRGKVEGEKDFDDRKKAEKYAALGNSRDKVGGKYTVTVVNEELEEAKVTAFRKLDAKVIKTLKSMDPEDAKLIIQGLPKSLRQQALKATGIKESDMPGKKVDGRTKAYKETAARLMAKKIAKEQTVEEKKEDDQLPSDHQYMKGVAKDKQDDKQRQIDRQTKMSDDDPDAYKPMPGDKDKDGNFKKTKVSKHTKKYHQMYGEEQLVDEDFQEEIEEDADKSLAGKAKKSGIPVGILKQVYNRGMAAWKTGHRPGASQQQWAHARVNSFITKGSGTWGKADKDLAAKAKKSMKEEMQDEACWDGYKQVGMKNKGGKMVPDCVPESTNFYADYISKTNLK